MCVAETDGPASPDVIGPAAKLIEIMPTLAAYHGYQDSYSPIAALSPSPARPGAP